MKTPDVVLRAARCLLPIFDRICIPLATHHGLVRAAFALLVSSLLAAKAVHLHAHSRSLTPGQFLLWGVTFFCQDLLVVLLARLVMQPFKQPWARVLAAAAGLPFCFTLAFMAASNVSFYIVTGAEVHWTKAGSFQLDAAAIRTLLSGLTAFLIFSAVILVLAWFTGTIVYYAVGEVLRVVWACIFPLVSRCYRWGHDWVRRRWLKRSGPAIDAEAYGLIASDDDDENKYHDDDELGDLNGVAAGGHTVSATGRGGLEDSPSVVVFDSGNDHTFDIEKLRTISLAKRIAILLPLVLLLLLRIVRPHDPAYIFLSLTLLATPFVHGEPGPHVVNAGDLLGNYGWLRDRTALTKPPAFEFLPSDEVLDGWIDWGPSSGIDPKVHYSAAKDPLHISNLQRDVLEPLRGPLQNGSVSIKHIVFFKLESTRADVFPLRNNSFWWNKVIKDSYEKEDKSDVPEEVTRRIANLTRTAESLTGFRSGFDNIDIGPPKREAYGGLSASNAFTTGTYTLKSLVGSLCGVTPLVADFNREYDYHIYQPCMPHIFDALNRQSDVSKPNNDDYRTWPWHHYWMQSVTTTYDNQEPLMPAMGYTEVVCKESMEEKDAPHYPPKSKEVNYYGYPDTEIRPYLNDALDQAIEKNERLFITHLTGTTHHPWGIPGDKYKEMLASSWRGRNRDINKYLNSIGFADRWLDEIIDLLDEKGVRNETLLVMAGDHGLSLPNDGGITPYDNPHVGSFQVPLVLAHPQLPPVEIEAPVTSMSLVPSILDLLIESSSLGEVSTQAAKDMRSLYEGQSLIRELIQEEEVQVPAERTSGPKAKGRPDGEDKKGKGRSKADPDEEDEPVEKRPIMKQDWQFTVMNTGGSWLGMRSAAKPKWRLVVPLIEDLEWRFTDLDTDPYEEAPVMEFNLDRLAKRLKKDHEHGEEVAQWLGDAAQVSQWWIEDNWRRYKYRGE